MTRTQSKVPECQKCRRLPPIASPAARCSQKPYGFRGPASAPTADPRKTRPMTSVRIADQSPPPDRRSVTSTHERATTGSISSG